MKGEVPASSTIDRFERCEPEELVNAFGVSARVVFLPGRRDARHGVPWVSAALADEVLRVVGAARWIGVSCVGFNDDTSEALVGVAIEGSGFYSDAVYLLRLVDGRWAVVRRWQGAIT